MRAAEAEFGGKLNMDQFHFDANSLHTQLGRAKAVSSGAMRSQFDRFSALSTGMRLPVWVICTDSHSFVKVCVMDARYVGY